MTHKGTVGAGAEHPGRLGFIKRLCIVGRNQTGTVGRALTAGTAHVRMTGTLCYQVETLLRGERSQRRKVAANSSIRTRLKQQIGNGKEKVAYFYLM